MGTPKKKYPLNDHPEHTFIALGLVTDEPDYRLCWLLNQWDTLGLARTDDLLAYPLNSPVAQAYASFTSEGNEVFKSIRLVSNKSNEGIWLTAYKQVNFLLLLENRTRIPEGAAQLKKDLIGSIPQITGIFEIPGESLSGLL
jgi:hypothetical protein